jgi:predicted transcriptional regulator
MARKLKKVEKEIQTLYDLEYGEKQLKMRKMRNAHCRNWIKVRKLKNMENKKRTCRTYKW